MNFGFRLKTFFFFFFFSFQLSITMDFFSQNFFPDCPGALLGLTVTLKRFRYDPLGRTFLFGKVTLTELPSYVTSSLPHILFAVLSHAQLTVREAAVKCLHALVLRSSSEVAIRCLEEVVERLLPVGGGVVEAYEAEGLLKAAVTVIRTLPGSTLLPNALAYLAAFERYLPTLRFMKSIPLSIRGFNLIFTLSLFLKKKKSS